MYYLSTIPNYIMDSFYMQLPSNACPVMHKDNTASLYNTTLDTPISLEGQWEVALSEVSYSNSINTFAGEQIHIYNNFPSDIIEGKSRKRKLYIPTPGQFTAPKFTPGVGYIPNDICKAVNALHSTVFRLSCKGGKFMFIVNFPQVVVELSRPLAKLLGFSNYIFNTTQYSTRPTTLKRQIKSKYFRITVYPIYRTQAVTIILKEKGQPFTYEELLEKIHWKVRRQTYSTLDGFELLVDSTKDGKSHFKLRKFYQSANIETNDPGTTLNLLIELNTSLAKRLGFIKQRYFSTNAIYPADIHIDTSDTNDFINETWLITAHSIHLDPLRLYNQLITSITPKSRLYDTPEGLCSGLNSKLLKYKIKFNYSKEINRLTISIPDWLKVKFDSNMANLLGFTDASTDFVVHTKTADHAPLLDHNVNTMFFYTNFINYINVGSGKAPLLRSISYSRSLPRRPIETEFTHLYFIKVACNYLSHIEIAVRDEVGELIPFTKDALTNVVLHFRRIS